MPPHRFQLGLDTVAFHPRRAVREVRDRAEAVRIVAAMVRDNGERAVLDLAREVEGSRSPDDLEDAVRLLADLLVSGACVLIAERSDPRRLSAPKSVPLADLIDPSPFEPAAAWIALRVITDHGVALAGAHLLLDLPDGSVRDVRLDDSGTWNDEAIPSGTCTLRALEPLKPGPAKGEGVIEPQPNDQVWSGDIHAPLSLRSNKEHRIIVRSPRAGCVRLVGMSFAWNKTFLLPSALEGIRLLQTMVERYPEAEVLIVGHTDRTGSAGPNMSLSLERARAVSAFVRDDVEGWYRYYSTDTAGTRWGAAEDLAMLAALPFGEQPYYSPEHEEHSIPDAVRRFQTARGLVVDGIAGPVTRRELIREYMSADATSLAPEVRTSVHGCGESFPAVETDDDIEEPKNRRVELFFFDEGIQPVPSANTSGPEVPWYPAWLEAIEEERTFTPSEAGFARLHVVTDIETPFVEEAGVRFRLEATDGSYERELDPVEDGVDVNGRIDLDFTDIPKGAFFTLRALHASGAESILFEDVPYPELQLVSQPRKPDLTHPIEDWDST